MKPTRLQAKIEERVFHFRQPAATSRGVYTERRSWLVHLSDGRRTGIGECAPLPDLSCDAVPGYADVLAAACRHVAATGSIDHDALDDYPSIRFGLETALLSMQRGPRLFDTPFCRGEQGIAINGLVWMGSYEEMLARLEDKLAQGFTCIKLKVGAIDFDRELDLVRTIRSRHSRRQVEIRLDANGGFDFEGTGHADDALYRLELLAQYGIHSIEQPIAARQWSQMAELCRNAPLPIALDEELIGINDAESKRQMLNIIRPAWIVLKPSLHGGMKGCREWVEIAGGMGIGSWVTSALESNVGLAAVAQLSSALYDPIRLPQGLGTGQLFTDNIDMPLAIRGQQLWMDAVKSTD